MSAAEPADTAAYYVNAGPDATVIPLTKHRAGRTTSRGWRNTMEPTPGPDTPEAPVSADPVAELAEMVERSLLDIGRSLSEPATRAVFDRTLDWWQRTLEGSQATGIITAEQLAQLLTTVQHMRQAPRLV